MDMQADGPEAPQGKADGPEPEQARVEPGVEEPAAEAMESQVSPLTAGQIVDGLIVHIDEHGALVDVGTKSEGHISAAELAGGTTDEGKPLAVGDRVAVYVVRPEDEDGNPVLSKKKADYERVWQRLTHAFEHGEVLSAMVTDRVKGGLVVDLGMRGFLPASHVRTRNVHALDRFVGQSVKVKIVEVDRARKRVVVSQKEALEEERRRRREQTLASIVENKIYKGVVRRIADYGAFVDIGGVDGLLHITEMSWTRINHPSDVVKVGDRIDVMVLRFDKEHNRISLGLKQILPDPWEQVKDQFRVGQTVSGTVTRVVPFGAFLRLESGIEGIIPNAEMPGNRGQRAQDVLNTGDTVQAKIVSIRAGERRMTLSLRQVQQAQERRQLKEYMERQQQESRVTIGDLVGDVLSESQLGQHTEAVSEPAAKAASEPALESHPQSVAEPAVPASDQEEQAPAGGEAPASEPQPADEQGAGEEVGEGVGLEPEV
jgi:4-hydroxy-3-methylbut-2-enyl diphosphate reductase